MKRAIGSRGAAVELLEGAITGCTRCPELRTYCAGVARVKRAAYSEQTYWGKPVPGFGDPRARIWILGLAPGAHGANRTGRVFTGDRSGDFLFAALHRAGIANQPTSVARDDGLALRGAWISAAVRCAPPDNKPMREQIAACRVHLDREWDMLRDVRVIVCLGAIAWTAALALCARHGLTIPRPRQGFTHGAELKLGNLRLLGCYHVSQQNTFTGRLTPTMLDRVLGDASGHD